MVSTDRDILLDINGRLIHLEGEQAKQRQDFSEFKALVLKRLDNIETDITIIKHDQAALQTSVYWFLGVVTLFLTALGMIGIIATIITAFRKSERSQPDSKTLIASLTDAITKGLTASRKEGQV